MGDAEDRIARFARALRGAGLRAGPGQVLDFALATAMLGPEDLYWAGRVTLVSRPEEIPPYDRVFGEHFGGLRGEPPRRRRAVQERQVISSDPDSDPTVQEVEATLPELAVASATELLRTKDFARCDADELARLAVMMRGVWLEIPPRVTRRRRRARRGEMDVRRTMRSAFRTGGEPIHRQWRVRRELPRRLVLLLDVSGSMAEHSRPLLIFAHAALLADHRVEAFSFGTRLTRLTRALATRNPDTALARASAEALDWDGGTRIGESVKTFIDRYGHSGLARGAVVVICSDGLDVGEPALLGHQMARLRRLAHRVVWLNPLKASEVYEPLAGGMRAALPSVDLFVSGHNLASLEAMAAELRRAQRPLTARPVSGGSPGS